MNVPKSVINHLLEIVFITSLIHIDIIPREKYLLMHCGIVDKENVNTESLDVTSTFVVKRHLTSG
jgi:hypothetical protein